MLKILLILVTLLSTISHGYSYFRDTPAWAGTMPLFFNPENCPDTIETRIERNITAASTWVDISYQGQTRIGHAQDYKSVLICSDVFTNALIDLPPDIEVEVTDLLSESGDSIAGRALVYWRTSDNKIIECDIQIMETAGAYEQAAVRHEFAHCLGLKHSDDEGALMFPTINNLGADYQHDDIAGLCGLYPCEEAIADYLGNIFIPRARRVGDPELFRGVLNNFDVIYGEVIEGGK